MSFLNLTLVRHATIKVDFLVGARQFEASYGPWRGDPGVTYVMVVYPPFEGNPRTELVYNDGRRSPYTESMKSILRMAENGHYKEVPCMVSLTSK